MNMRSLTPKSVSISLVTIACAFIGGMALTAHGQLSQSSVRPLDARTTDVIATASDPTTTTAPSAPATSSPTTTTTDTTTSTAPATSTTLSAPTDTQTGTTTTQGTATPAVTAVSADVSDWSDPSPAGQPYPQGTMVRYVYCTWTYSDGTTQQVVMRTRYTYQNGSDVQLLGDTTCDVASAPATN